MCYIWRLGMVVHSCNPRRWETKVGGLPEVRVQDQPGQHGETLSLLKIQKLAVCGCACLLSQLLQRLRQENQLETLGADVAVS